MFDRKLLATVSGIKHFCSRIKGRPFKLWTDHKSLLFAHKRVSLPSASSVTWHSYLTTLAT